MEAVPPKRRAPRHSRPGSRRKWAAGYSRVYADPEVRFWERVRSSRDGCWEWTRTLDKDGYGLFSVNKKNARVHRFSWELHNGPIPSGLLVCHHCDNPRCVRPDHLFLGTVADNSHDCVRKGRHFMGDNMKPTIPASEATVIVEMRKTMTLAEVGRVYGCNASTVCRYERIHGLKKQRHKQGA